MGTRSRVGVQHGDVIKSVYCHYDGYLDYTGEILDRHYDSTLANALVARGDNSGVKETLAEINFYDDPKQRREAVRDFLDSTPWQIAHSFEEFLEQVRGCGAEYYYVMQDGVWSAGAVYNTTGLIRDGLVPLAEALAAVTVDKLVEEE